MVTIESTGSTLGARVRGIDLAKPLSDADFGTIVLALGRYGVLQLPEQRIDALALRDFSQRFGCIQGSVTGKLHEPGVPEVGILSNVIENGEPIGLPDAGQDWHTDMSYNETIGFLNVLSTSSPRPRAVPCWRRCSHISSSRSTSTSTGGPWATCSCGITSARSTMRSPTTGRTSTGS